MPIHRTQLHVLAYDISMDPARLVQVHRIVRKWGFPLQYSGFLIPATPAQIRVLLAELETTIDPRRDDIRVYPLPTTVDIVQLGRGSGDEGLNLFADKDATVPTILL